MDTIFPRIIVATTIFFFEVKICRKFHIVVAIYERGTTIYGNTVYLFIRGLIVDHLSFSGALAFHKLQARKCCVAFKHLDTRCDSPLKKLKWLSKSPQYHRFLQLSMKFTSACTLLHIIAKCDSYQGV